MMARWKTSIPEKSCASSNTPPRLAKACSGWLFNAQTLRNINIFPHGHPKLCLHSAPECWLIILRPHGLTAACGLFFEHFCVTSISPWQFILNCNCTLSGAPNGQLGWPASTSPRLRAFSSPCLACRSRRRGCLSCAPAAVLPGTSCLAPALSRL
jgi:hypothetical protein